MSHVLHVQTRAYPLSYASLDHSMTTLAVPGRGELRLVPGTLASLSYNPEQTVEADILDLVRTVVDLPGITVVGCRIRLLTAGGAFVVYALRHEQDLRELDAHALADLDAQINRALREADREFFSEVLAAAVQAGLVRGPTIPPGGTEAREWTSVNPRTVRYNCHFIAQYTNWVPDARVPGLVLGPKCQILLPYTYAWHDDPSAERFDEIMTMLEPADIAVAQQSILVGATFGGRRILADLARGRSSRFEGPAFRRFLDGVWADYHHLDAYRVESGQDHRATYLAARQVIGLDGTHERAEKLLSHVNTSLVAESSQRSEHLDRRLNRVAAAFTVVAAASFLVDLISFVLPKLTTQLRIASAISVIMMAGGALGATLLWARRRGGRPPRSLARGTPK